MKAKLTLFFAFIWCICILLPLPVSAQLHLESLVFEGLGKPFLDNVSAVDISPDGQQVYTASFDDHALTVFSRDANTGVLTLLETQKNEIKGVAGLSGTYAVKVSTDGRHVYATGQNDDALVYFSRDPITGALTYLGMYQDGVNGIDGLNGAFQIEMTADGNYLYATGSIDNAIAVFKRNVVTGELTQKQVAKDGQAGIDHMNFPIALKISEDGKQMMVTSFGDNAIVVFNRNTNNGLLNFANAYKDGENGITGLAGAYGLTLSASGKDIYVSSSDANSVVHFRRYPNSGILAFSAVYKNGINGVSGLAGTAALQVSPDGQYLYAAGTGEDALVLFDRNTENGELIFASKLENGMNGITGLDYPVAIAVSKNTKDVYVAGFGANALVLFEREASSGMLDFAFAEQGSNQGVKGMQGAKTMSFSPDGIHCYVAGEGADALAVFERNESTGVLSFVNSIEDGNGIDGLNGVKDVLTSADGLFVYTAGFWDNAVALFSRNPTSGHLTYIDRYKDGLFGVNGLSGANALAMSPDQKHLYASGFWDHGLVQFTRNQQDGTLSFETVYLDGSNGINGLENISHIEMSMDGNYVYVAGKADHAIAVFSRDSNTGDLTYEYIYQDGVAGVDGLEGVHKIRIDMNGEDLYAISDIDNALVHFKRNAIDGSLNFVGLYQDGSAGGVNIGLEGVSDINLSKDNKRLYLTAGIENALSVYQRDLSNGMLSFEKIVYDGVDGVNGLADASSVQLSPDGQFIYTTGAADAAATVFSCKYIYDLEENICAGTVFELAGLTFEETGQYEETIVDGVCTTLIELDLRVQASVYNQSLEMCDGDLFILGNQAYNTSGTYSANFTSFYGCDSTVVVELSVVDAFTPTVVETTICRGETYLLGNEMLSESGVYDALLTSASGCDSMVQVNLNVLDAIQTDLVYTICQGEFFVIGGNNYHTNGFFSETLSSATGCDSIVNLALTIIPTAAVLNEAICEGDAFHFGNETYFEAGTYVGTYITSSGCEIQATLQLEVMPALLAVPEVIDDIGNGLGAVNLDVSGGVAPYKYQWSNGANGASVSNLFPGIYQVTVTDEINCQKELSINVNFVTATTALDPAVLDLEVWPNPVAKSNHIHLQFTQEVQHKNYAIKLLNAVGAMIWSENLTIQNGTILLPAPQESGLYFIQVNGTEGRHQLLKIVVQ